MENKRQILRNINTKFAHKKHEIELSLRAFKSGQIFNQLRNKITQVKNKVIKYSRSLFRPYYLDPCKGYSKIPLLS